MLENLRDFPRDLANIHFQNLSDGIVEGTEITVQDKVLTVSPGIIKFRGDLYLLKDKTEIPYEATGRLLVLKIAFRPGTSSPDFDESTGKIILEDTVPNDQELELARFKLKEGATLRSSYLDFADMVTEYNTLNIVNAAYAGNRQGTLSPLIFNRFAQEMLVSGSSDPMDLMFALLCLNQGTIEREVAQQYLSTRSGTSYNEYDNYKLHQALALVLEETKGGRKKHLGGSKQGPQRMVVD
ncbi:DNA and RNA helicase [Paenibacillus sp. CAA11]|uniref:DNA and RNA helicase n=1 Tax=Paenibacillus sp. CAA11 TaxID=1532905 RepID=UPI001F2FAF05|nr:DNA and RNA helicase [Paenibacillus sp. CAA11]